MEDDTFQCAYCDGIFKKHPDQTDEKAWEKAREIFTPEALEQVDVVCEDCFHLLMGTPDMGVPEPPVP